MGRAYPIELTNMCMLQREDGCVLVQNRHDPEWGGLTFPGGHVEPGESLVDSVIREMREETGLTIRHPRLVGTKSWMQRDGSGRYLVLLYTAVEYEGGAALLRRRGRALDDPGRNARRKPGGRHGAVFRCVFRYGVQ